MSWKIRTQEAEIMDDVSLDIDILKQNLREITLFNRLLGGDRVTLNGIEKLLKKCAVHGPVHITDIGCGDGEMLRRIEQWATKRNLDVRLCGVDFNPNAIKIAQETTASDGIKYLEADILTLDASAFRADIVLCTLTLHHFEDASLAAIVQKFIDASRCGVVVNDLRRSKFAYLLFRVVSRVFMLSRTSRNDGKISIRRGFTKTELKKLSKSLIFKNQTIRHRWAFRLQWIIKAP